MYFFILTGVAFLAGISVNNILRKITIELLEETERFEDSTETFFKQMKLRYENCIKIGHEINNTEAFATKYLEKYKHRGMSIYAYEKLAGIMSGLCVVCGVCGALMDKNYAMEYLLCGFLAMYILSGTLRLLDISDKKKRITLNIVDYFENRFYPAATMEAESAVSEDSVTEPQTNKAQTVTVDERKLIDEILREYLG